AQSSCTCPPASVRRSATSAPGICSSGIAIVDALLAIAERRRSMQRHVIQTRLASFIAKNFPVARKRNIGVDDRLLGEGIIHSLGVLDIVGPLESEFGISVADEDLSTENFETITRLTALVERKLGEARTEA